MTNQQGSSTRTLAELSSLVAGAQAATAEVKHLQALVAILALRLGGSVEVDDFAVWSSSYVLQYERLSDRRALRVTVGEVDPETGKVVPATVEKPLSW